MRLLGQSVVVVQAALLLAWAARSTTHPGPADIVFQDAAVYTVDASRSWASAVAVQSNRIVYVGTDGGARLFIGPNTRVVDLHGRMLLPGFQDSHVHPQAAGLSLDGVQLDGLLTKEQVFAAVREFAQAHLERAWIRGFGWMETPFLPSGMPTREMLDKIVSDRPVFLVNNSGHAAWVNSRALAIAGITAGTPDPPNGKIEHEPDGQPSGMLQEYATELVRSHIPPWSADEKRTALVTALRLMSHVGVTAIEDAWVTPDVDSGYAALRGKAELPVRATLCQAFDPERDDDVQTAEFIARRAANSSGMLQETCVKIMLDGVPEHHTAALLAPYADEPQAGDGPPLFVEPGRLQRLVTRLDREGFQLHFHAIGDRAVREALNALEAARHANGDRDGRHTIAHLDLVDPADLPRFRELSVVANMSPLWNRGDDWELVFAPRLFGPERSKRLLQCRALLASGAVLVWGSDWPVTGMSPVEGLETAVTRRYLGGADPAGKPDQAWIPEERLSLEQAIVAYTVAGAYLVHAESERGSIEAGKLADLVVLDRNLFLVPPLEIHTVATDMTMLNGKIVFER